MEFQQRLTIQSTRNIIIQMTIMERIIKLATKMIVKERQIQILLIILLTIRGIIMLIKALKLFHLTIQSRF
jgi:hypothetical protein